jgi:FKBP-type peptidyl-prolyl cis-trans isomerase 2
MGLQKNDFIEIEFVGKIKGGAVFDSNIADEMFLEGIENFLIGKEIGEYEIELSPEKAFGKRNPDLIQRMPTKVFIEHKINPIPGAVFNFDNKIGKVLAVSGGRVMMDFNNPLAGKEVVYKINILRKVEDINEKIKALNDFFFRRDFKFEVIENKIILEAEKEFKSFIELFKEKYKEILRLDLEVKEIENLDKNNNNP